MRFQSETTVKSQWIKIHNVSSRHCICRQWRKKSGYVTPNIIKNTEWATRYTQSAFCGGFVRSLAFYTLDYCLKYAARARWIRMTPSKTPLFMSACRFSFDGFSFRIFQQWNDIQYGSMWIKCESERKRNLYQNKYAFFELFIFMCMNLDCVCCSYKHWHFSPYSIKPIKAYNGSFVNDIDVRAHF